MFELCFSLVTCFQEMSDSDDDVPRLSADTLAALQEFYNETSHPDAPTAASADKFSVGAVGEDWVGTHENKHSTHRHRANTPSLVQTPCHGGEVKSKYL